MASLAGVYCRGRNSFSMRLGPVFLALGVPVSYALYTVSYMRGCGLAVQQPLRGDATGRRKWYGMPRPSQRAMCGKRES